MFPLPKDTDSSFIFFIYYLPYRCGLLFCNTVFWDNNIQNLLCTFISHFIVQHRDHPRLYSCNQRSQTWKTARVSSLVLVVLSFHFVFNWLRNTPSSENLAYTVPISLADRNYWPTNNVILWCNSIQLGRILITLLHFRYLTALICPLAVCKDIRM